MKKAAILVAFSALIATGFTSCIERRHMDRDRDHRNERYDHRDNDHRDDRGGYNHDRDHR